MPILLVPGLGELAAHLCACHPRAVAVRLGDRGQPYPRRHYGPDRARVLAEAPPRFALVGHSMGGYIALEIMRQAPERVAKLALLNTQARPDTPEASERRRGQIARAEGRRLHAGAGRIVSGHRASVAARRRRAARARARHGRGLRRRGLRAPADRGDRPRRLAPHSGDIGCRRWCCRATRTIRFRTALGGDGAMEFPARSSRSCRIAATSRRSSNRRHVADALDEWLRIVVVSPPRTA